MTYFSHFTHRDHPSPPRSPATHQPPNHSSNPFDPNLYIPTPSATPFTPDGHCKSDSQSSMDFSEELAALMKATPASVPQNRGHPGTGRDTPSSFDDYSRHPPHNIFDVSTNPNPHFPSHAYSIPIPSHPLRSGSTHRGTESPYNSPYTPHSESGFNQQHISLPSPLLPLNMNAHLPPSGEELSASPFLHHPPHSAVDFRSDSPFGESRSRSRSKPPMTPVGLKGPHPARSRLSKQRASLSGIERPHIERSIPTGISIPSNGSRPSTAGGSAPLSAHPLSGWPHFGLPTPDSLPSHPYSPLANGSPKSGLSQMKKEEAVESDPAVKQVAMANEKRRRRRESHNAVERRRRDNINEKISELATLIPECMLDPNMSAGGTNSGGEGNGVGIEVFAAVTSQPGEDGDMKDAPAIKANKGMILRKSVDYIRYLQQLVTAQASRNRDLEARLHHFQPHDGSSSISSPHSSDGASDINGQNFHVFSDDVINGINGMGMVDILHSLSSEDNDSYLSMPFTAAQLVKSPLNNAQGLETLHEVHRAEVDHDMDMDDSSRSASSESPEDSGEHDARVHNEEAERGRSRRKSRLIDGSDVDVKREPIHA